MHAWHQWAAQKYGSVLVYHRGGAGAEVCVSSPKLVRCVSTTDRAHLALMRLLHLDMARRSMRRALICWRAGAAVRREVLLQASNRGHIPTITSGPVTRLVALPCSTAGRRRPGLYHQWPGGVSWMQIHPPLCTISPG